MVCTRLFAHDYLQNTSYTDAKVRITTNLPRAISILMATRAITNTIIATIAGIAIIVIITTIVILVAIAPIVIQYLLWLL